MRYWLWRLWRLAIVVFDSATLRVAVSIPTRLIPTDPRVSGVLRYRGRVIPFIVDYPFYLYNANDHTLAYLFKDLAKLGFPVESVQVKVNKHYRLLRQTPKVRRLIERLK